MYIKQMVYVLEKMKIFVGQFKKEPTRSYIPNEFSNTLNIDNINILKLQEYLKESKLAQKVLLLYYSLLATFLFDSCMGSVNFLRRMK